MHAGVVYGNNNATFHILCAAGLPSTVDAVREAIQSIERYRRDKSDRQTKTSL